MPTENRSSNTEMVSALKKAFTTAESGNGEYRIVMKFQSLADMQDCHHKLTLALSGLTEQNQSDPVALPDRKTVTAGLLSESNTHNRGWNACLDEIAKLGPLYTRPVQVEPAMWANQLGDTITDKVKTHNLSLGGAPAAIAKSYTQPLYTHPAPADPGEVERLRAALKFYADREHYHFESGNWDTVSGEPLNILWCGDEPDFIEDGTVARAALERQP